MTKSALTDDHGCFVCGIHNEKSLGDGRREGIGLPFGDSIRRGSHLGKTAVAHHHERAAGDGPASRRGA